MVYRKDNWVEIISIYKELRSGSGSKEALNKYKSFFKSWQYGTWTHFEWLRINFCFFLFFLFPSPPSSPIHPLSYTLSLLHWFFLPTSPFFFSLFMILFLHLLPILSLLNVFVIYSSPVRVRLWLKFPITTKKINN